MTAAAPAESAAAHGRRLTVGTISLFAASAVSLPAGIITAAFLSDRFDAAGYGTFAVVVAIVLWFELCATQFFARPTVKLIAESDSWRQAAAVIQRSQLAVGVGAALLLGLLAPLIASGLGAPEQVGALRLLALDIPLYALAQNTGSILIGRGAYQQRALLVAVRWITRTVLIVLLVSAGMGLTGALIGCIGASLIELIVGRLLVRAPLWARLPGLRLTAYVVPTTLHTLGFELFKRLDLIAVEALGSAGAAGYYAAAQNLTIVPTLFAMSLSPLLLSALARLLRADKNESARADKNESAQALAQAALRAIVLLLPFAGAAAAMSEEVVALIYGAEFAASAPIMAVLIFGALAITLHSAAAAVLMAADRPGWVFALNAPLAPLALALQWSVVPIAGAVGAALVSTILAGISTAIMLAAVARVWGVTVPIKSWGRALVLTGAVVVLSQTIPVHGVALVLQLTGVTLVVATGYTLMGEITPSERRFAWSLLPLWMRPKARRVG